MLPEIKQLLQKKNILFHQNEGITIATVASLHEGFSLAKAMLYELVDRKTALYLSGGSTPKVLYEQLAKEERLVPGVVGLVDERFGLPMHEKSNEKMIGETRFLHYLQMRDVPFYPMLQNKNRDETAARYDDKLRSLNATFQKSVAILGIGSDGHTAGIAGNRKDFKNPLFDPERKNVLVSEFDDPNSPFGERVTMTFLGLSMLDILIVLAFGAEKKEALELLFKNGSEEEIPARFYKRSEISPKTIFITDQRI